MLGHIFSDNKCIFVIQKELGPILQIFLRFLLEYSVGNSGELFPSIIKYLILILVRMIGSRNRLSYFHS